MKSRFTARGQKAGAGYTILEVMIVMAVTGGLFVSVALMFNGRTGKTELTQAVRDYESRIQTVVNDVVSGYYPNGYQCRVNGLWPQINPLADSTKAGANEECIAVGKVLAIHENDFSIMTLVGRHYRTGPIPNLETTTMQEALPVVVSSVTEQYLNRFDLEVKKVFALRAPNTDIGAFAIASELGEGVSGGTALTGSRSIRLYSIRNSDLGDSENQTENKIRNPPPINTFIDEPQGIRICFEGGNGDKAAITIGTTSDQSSTTVKIGQGVGTDCD